MTDSEQKPLFSRRAVSAVVLAIYFPLIFALSHIHVPRIVCQAQVSDKVIHFTGYLLLVFMVWFVVRPNEKVNWRRASVWLVLIGIMWYGVIDEWLQSYVGRTADIKDFLADVGGAAAGLILFSLATFWPALLTVAAITIFLLTNVASANIGELAPVTNIIFHFFAYGFITFVWIRFCRIFLRLEITRSAGVIMGLFAPALFLLAVKLSSILLGRYAGLPDMIFAAAGIFAATATGYVIQSLRRPMRGKFNQP